MNEKTVIDFLAIQNKWWYSKKGFPVRKVFNFKRSDYAYLSEHELQEKEATIIYGPRGVGKSTVMTEIIRKLLGLPEKREEIEKIDESAIKGIEKRRVLYITFEEPVLKRFKILDLLSIYAKYVLGESISDLKEGVFVFLDEIQNVSDWGDQLKIIQDLNYSIKFFVSGSSSIAMKNEASKGARRFNLYSMHPLKFSDFLCYKICDESFERILKEGKKNRNNIKEFHSKNDAESIYTMFLKLYNDLKPWQTKIEILFDEYMIKGGYPAFLEETDYSKCSSKLLRDFLLGFHKDLVVGKGLGDPVGIKDLLLYVASISSCETNYTSLMKNSGAAANTEILKKYLYHLKNAFLTESVSKLPRGSLKKEHSFKIYLVDVAIRNMLMGLMNDLLFQNQTQYGYATETLVFDHIIRLYFKMSPGSPIYYWKDERTGKEVDIILKFNGQTIPIEIKKNDSPSLSDVEGLKTFCDGSPGIVSCGKRLEIIENIIFLPHWLLVFIC